MNTNTTTPPPPAKGSGCLHALLVVIIILLIAILGSLWWLKQNMYATEFKPVELSDTEELLLDAKLNSVDPSLPASGSMAFRPPPEVYSEEADLRKIVFSQNELNAVLAKDVDLAKRVRIHLSDELVSIQFITPMDESLPMLGGKTFKFNMGVGLAFTNDKPTVVIRGISIGGIPVPSAWWGDIKNKNLVDTFGASDGFWNLFSKGVAYMEVKDDRFILHLKE